MSLKGPEWLVGKKQKGVSRIVGSREAPSSRAGRRRSIFGEMLGRSIRRAISVDWWPKDGPVAPKNHRLVTADTVSKANAGSSFRI